MKFIQLVELRTESFDEIERLHRQWLSESDGQGRIRREQLCRDRSDPNRYVMIVEFDSHDDATLTNELPATVRGAAGMAAIADGAIKVQELDVVRAD